MKIQRKWLLIATGAIAVFMILYSLARQFLGFNLGEAFEKTFFDGIFIAAIGLLMLNRKIASDEKKAAKEAEEGTDGTESGTGRDSGSVEDGSDAEGR
jgi:hypothetical protein